ncbi:MAG TPA: hypothetical protein ENM98_00440, partial [Halothiobacillaceae bacterium]|nr:hypothetical protein [Halothiobacillaceae bacterium]
MTTIRISPQTLGHLLPECPAALSDVSVSAICDDHREISGEDTLFFARRTASGKTFAAQALDAGAALVLADENLNGHPRILACAEPAQVLASIISQSQGWSSQLPNITAVTGTNGKSSVTHLLAGLYEAIGQKTAVIGTLGAGRFTADGSGLTALANTTPSLLANWDWLIRFAQQGIEQIVMEVSSHALDQNRVAGLPIKTAVFTQISRDHLDYHADFAAYQQAKLQLLAHRGLKTVVFDADTLWADELAERASAQSLSTICFSLNDDPRADVQVRVAQSGFDGMSLDYQWRADRQNFYAQTRLVG